MDQITMLVNMIVANINRLIVSVEFQDWIKDISLSTGDLLLINNSVLYRGDAKFTKTKKSSKYICLSIVLTDPLNFEVFIIDNPNRKIKNFTHVIHTSKDINSFQKTPLHEAIEQELNSLGKLVFILLGEIDATDVFNQAIDHPLFTSIIVDHSINTPIKLIAPNIYIKEMQDAEILWDQFVHACSCDTSMPNPLPDDLVGKFANSVAELRKNSFVKLIIPNTGQHIDNCFLDQIINSLKENMSEYSKYLNDCADPNNNRNEYNNILRISYTFAEEIIKILRLFIGISDLKPLFFWMTVNEQFQFSFALERLPWEKLGSKPELGSYVEAIKGARNKAFHNLLQFNQTMEVQMGDITIRPTKLRLFTEFTTKGNVFEYEDKDLIEILTEFTRASEKYVSFDFWKRNQVVMEKTLCLLEAFSCSLKALNG